MKVMSGYQVEAYRFLLDDKFRCLFDEPGCGKTGPAIMAGWEKKQGTAPVLVTAPAYLLPNWEREIHDFIPNAVVVRADGAGLQARTTAFTSDADFVLTSYNNWGAKYDRKSNKAGELKYPQLDSLLWSAYIFDEGHRLRGRNSGWTKHVFRVRNTRSTNLDTPIWILSGTPFVRDGGDFFPYFHLYNKKKYGSYWKFVNERCVVVETPWKKQVANIRKSYQSEFRRELAQFSLRRTTSEIPELRNLEYSDTEYFVKLPKSVITTIKKAKKEYVLEHEDLARTEFLSGAGALYVRQRQIATIPPTKEQPKIEWLKDFLTDKKGKIVVYVWYKDSARMVASALGDKAILITGDIAANKRDAYVSQWKDSSGPQILVATIPSLKEGISLTEARDVVFLEHSELPSDQEQCIKRLCRRGQNHLVQAHHVWARSSVDMPIRLVNSKRDIGMAEALEKWIEDDSEEGTEEDWFV